MMKKFLTVMIAAIFFVAGANAQDEVTDKDLQTYALIELSKEAIVSQISPMVNDLIAKQEGMTGQRFNELRKANGDWASVEAQDWEIKFYEIVNEEMDEKKEAAGQVVKVMASHGLGAAKYKAVKTALGSDAAVKARYDAIYGAMKSASAGS